MPGTTSPSRRLLIALTAALVLVAACGDDADESDAVDTPTTEESAADADTTTTTGSTTSTTAGEPDEPPPPADGTVVEATVRDGEIDAPGRVEVDGGSEVTVTVTSDAADELHVHGYDLTQDLVPGEPTSLTFTADLPGVFEVELHDAGLLFELAVT